MKCWEIVANNLKNAAGGWAESQLPILRGERSGLWDANREGTRFIVRADEKLTAFVELERAIYEFAVGLISWNFTSP